MAVLYAQLRTRSDCDREVNSRMRKLAEVRIRLNRKDNTPHVRAGLKGEERSLQDDIAKIKAHKGKLRS